MTYVVYKTQTHCYILKTIGQLLSVVNGSGIRGRADNHNRYGNRNKRWINRGTLVQY